MSCLQWQRVYSKICTVIFYRPGIDDIEIGKLSAGSHTLKLSVDNTNLISETDETDNIFSKTFVVSSPTFTPILTKDEVTIYPNPVVGTFQISGTEGKAMLTLTDINGRLVLTKEVLDNEPVSVSTLPQGVYIVRITTTNGMVEKKLVKK